MTFLDDFMMRAALAGLGLAIAAAPLGCFVVWRRMAYFGDATAHAAILGVALSLTFSASIFAGVLVVSLVMAVTVSTLSGCGFAMDTLLGVAIACGSVVAGLQASFHFDTPTGPTIVCVTAVLFALSLSVAALLRSKALSRKIRP